MERELWASLVIALKKAGVTSAAQAIDRATIAVSDVDATRIVLNSGFLIKQTLETAAKEAYNANAIVATTCLPSPRLTLTKEPFHV